MTDKENMKSYTDISQSKILSQILPVESADLKWFFWMEESNASKSPSFGYSKTVAKTYKDTEAVYLPCWSLVALLSILPYPFLSELSNGIWKCGCYPSGICYYVTADSPIDACVAMILKLNELKML